MGSGCRGWAGYCRGKARAATLTRHPANSRCVQTTLSTWMEIISPTTSRSNWIRTAAIATSKCHQQGQATLADHFGDRRPKLHDQLQSDSYVVNHNCPPEPCWQHTLRPTKRIPERRRK